MKKFACAKCGNGIYFENVNCIRCGSPLAFEPGDLAMVTLKSSNKFGGYSKSGGDEKDHFLYCANAAHGVCNWSLHEHDDGTLCRACVLNKTIPNLSEADGLLAWGKLERAKKLLIYSLLRLGLPFDAPSGTTKPLSFDFVRNTTTGHADGLVTVDIVEADAVERERQRQFFHEPYRSLLGHLRHECGHYYWSSLVENTKKHNEFRELFGDERQDYASALARHHANGPPPDWQARYVSAYASSHPWEDWAETWAHYLHLVESLDTSQSEGFEPRSAGIAWGAIWPFKPQDVYRHEKFESLASRWIALTLAMNRLSRSMGQDDFYPFVISPAARAKLEFIHDAIRSVAS